MELDQLTPEMPRLLVEMGIAYDPEKLASVLADKWPQVYGRAISIAALLGGFVARLVQVCCMSHAAGAGFCNGMPPSASSAHILSG